MNFNHNLGLFPNDDPILLIETTPFSLRSKVTIRSHLIPDETPLANQPAQHPLVTVSF